MSVWLVFVALAACASHPSSVNPGQSANLPDAAIHEPLDASVSSQGGHVSPQPDAATQPDASVIIGVGGQRAPLTDASAETPDAGPSGMAGQRAPLTDASADAAPAIDATAPDAESCTGMTPMCFRSCGGDQLVGDAMCGADGWTCKNGVLPKDCPASACFGVPAFAEVCVAGAWECHPDDEAFTRCPALACATCKAFTSPVEKSGCRCECAANGTVTCKHI